MRCTISYVCVLVVFGSGCGVSQKEFDGERQRRAAAETKVEEAIADANSYRAKSEEFERQFATARQELATERKQRAAAEQTAADARKAADDLAAHQSNLVARVTTLQSQHDVLKRQIEIAEIQRKKWRESAVDFSNGIIQISVGPEGFKNLRIRYDGMVRPTPLVLRGLERDLNGRRVYGIAVGATPTKQAAFQAEDEKIRGLTIQEKLEILKSPQHPDVDFRTLNTSFFAVSEQLRDDLLKRGASAGLSLEGRGNVEVLWNARLFFIVRQEGWGKPISGLPKLCGQLYRIELFAGPQLSGDPVAVVEDEELMENPNPPPPKGPDRFE